MKIINESSKKNSVRNDSVRNDLIKNFFLSGLIGAIISYVGTFGSPLLGAIVWSFPSSVLPSMYFMHLQGKDNIYLADFAISTTFSILLLLVSTYALNYFFKNSSKDELLLPIAKSISVWTIFSIIFYYIVRHFRLESYFL